MSDQFLPFQSFSDIELAKQLSEKLSEYKIVHVLDAAAPILDSNILGVSSNPDYTIKLRSSDFIAANQALENYYQTQIATIEPDYYLFTFSNEELQEIVSKPDEWNPLDYQLSQKILKDRGISIDNSKLEQLKADRKKELSKPEKSGSSLITAGYILIFTGFTAVLVIINKEELNYFPFGLLLSAIFSHHLKGSKKTLPDGQSAYLFNDPDRKHGTILFYGSIFFLLFTLAFFLFSSAS